MTKPTVYVAIPSLSGNVTRQMLGFLATLTELRHSKDCPWWFEWDVVGGASPSHYARNLMTKAFLKSGCERLWMIDGDMTPPDDWSRMLQVDADIVGGKCIGYWWNDDKILCLRLLAVRRVGGKHVTVLPQDPEPIVDGCGTGSMLIHRRVFDHPGMRLSGAYTDAAGVTHDLWQQQDEREAATPYWRNVYDAAGRRIVTDDYDFCFRARDLGFTVALSDTWWDQSAELSLRDVNRALLHHIDLAQKEAGVT
jgi:hypothetical protein